MSQPNDVEVGGGTGAFVPTMKTDNSPRHGFQGNRVESRAAPEVPLGLSISVSREAGARGATISRLVGEKLGWQVHDQELLEYMAQNPVVRQGLTEGLPDSAIHWIDQRLRVLTTGRRLTPDVLNLARVVLALGASGSIVLVGRGGGCILPAETTLHVRIVAPLADRIAYMGQWLRLSHQEASERVRQLDERRAEFVTKYFGRVPSEIHHYAMVLDSSVLGEDGCAELIAAGAKLRWALLTEREP